MAQLDQALACTPPHPHPLVYPLSHIDLLSSPQKVKCLHPESSLSGMFSPPLSQAFPCVLHTSSEISLMQKGAASFLYHYHC